MGEWGKRDKQSGWDKQGKRDEQGEQEAWGTWCEHAAAVACVIVAPHAVGHRHARRVSCGVTPLGPWRVHRMRRRRNWRHRFKLAVRGMGRRYRRTSL